MDNKNNQTYAQLKEELRSQSTPGLVASSEELVSAWLKLLQNEAVIAKHSLLFLGVGALVFLPVIVLGSWIGFNVLLVLALERLTQNWPNAIAVVCALQFLLLGTLLYRMRRWWHDLTLPQSRAALLKLAGGHST